MWPKISGASQERLRASQRRPSAITYICLLLNDPCSLAHLFETIKYKVQVFALVQYVYGEFSGMLETAEMANFHCDDSEVLPVLNMFEFTTE